MNDYQSLFADLRAAAGGAPYTEQLKTVLYQCGCYGFPERPVDESNSLTNAVWQIVINERLRVGKKAFAQLEKEHIPYVVVKGAVLSLRIYGNITARFSSDVDLLISRKYADVVKDCFIEHGFVRGRVVGNKIIPYSRREMIFQATHSHQMSPFVFSTGNKICPFVNYDVNMELFWGESGRHTDMELFLSDTIPMKLCDTEIQTLPVEKEFVALCLHHYKDLNSVYLLAERGVRLSHFFDIYGYLLTQKPNYEKLRNVCDSIGATKYVYLCVWYAYELFGQPFIKKYLEVLKTADGEKLLGFYGLNESDRRPWGMSLAERVFDETFSERFAKTLTDRDREIIRMNQDMM